jgi:hypothetical protein
LIDCGQHFVWRRSINDVPRTAPPFHGASAIKHKSGGSVGVVPVLAGAAMDHLQFLGHRLVGVGHDFQVRDIRLSLLRRRGIVVGDDDYLGISLFEIFMAFFELPEL